MTEIVSLFNRAFGAVIDLLLLPFRNLSPEWGLCFISLIAGVVFVVLYGRTSNQKALRTTKDKIYASLLESILYRHNVKLCLGAQTRMLKGAFRYFTLALQPLFILAIPCILLLAQLNLYYNVRPLQVGETVLLGADLQPGINTADVILDTPEGVQADAVVRMEALNRIEWRVRATADGDHVVLIRTKDGTTIDEKPIFVGAYNGPIADREIGSWWGNLLYPLREAGNASLKALSSLRVTYPAQKVRLFGIEMHWLVIFAILSILSGLVGAKLFKVEILRNMTKPNNVVMVIFDSCRFDSFVAAKTPNISKLGKVERCYAFASWTFPSHAVYLMGATPHRNDKGVFASEIYKKDFLRWSERLNIEGVNFGSFVPHLSIPAFLNEQGYKTNGLVSMPVLNQLTVMSQHFQSYDLMDNHNDFAAIIKRLKFDSAQPSFYFINVGETHYPYNLPGEPMIDYVKGPESVFKHSGDLRAPSADERANMTGDQLYFMDRMQELQQKQIKNVEYLDGLFEQLYQVVPQNTHIVVTSDHGELFGEEGYFGHGPVFHEKVFEVFLIEGKRP